MSSINIIYTSLTIIMLYILHLTGKKISALPQDVSWWKYFKTASFGIIFFTLNEGLRFGRGLDYNIYAQIYKDSTMDSFFEGGNFAYILVGKFLKMCNLPFQVYIILISFILIISVLIFVRNYKEIAHFSLPFFSLFYYNRYENVFRWYLAFSFVSIGLYFILKNNPTKIDYIKYTILSCVGFFFHFGIIFIPIIFFIIKHLFTNKSLRPLTSIILYISIGIIFQTKYMLILTDYIQIFSFLSDKANIYLENSDQWLTGGADVLTFKTFPSLTYSFLYCGEIILGYKIIQYNGNNYRFLYNLFSIGFILLPIANQIELYNRYNQLLLLYHTFIISYILKYIFSARYQINKICSLLFILIILNFSRMTIVKWLFEEPEYKHLYVWDSNGKDYLDLYSTYIYDYINTK